MRLKLSFLSILTALIVQAREGIAAEGNEDNQNFENNTQQADNELANSEIANNDLSGQSSDEELNNSVNEIENSAANQAPVQIPNNVANKANAANAMPANAMPTNAVPANTQTASPGVNTQAQPAPVTESAALETLPTYEPDDPQAQAANLQAFQNHFKERIGGRKQAVAKVLRKTAVYDAASVEGKVLEYLAIGDDVHIIEIKGDFARIAHKKYVAHKDLSYKAGRSPVLAP